MDLDDIDRIAAAAEAADGVAPIDEATRLTLANRARAGAVLAA